jgi:hypothetical protein
MEKAEQTLLGAALGMTVVVLLLVVVWIVAFIYEVWREVMRWTRGKS